MTNTVGLFGAILVPDWLSNWLTPIWLLGVGTLAGLILLGVLLGLLAAIGWSPIAPAWFRRQMRELPLAVREGVLWPVLWIAVGLAFFGVFGALFVRQPGEMLLGLTRLRVAGQVPLEFQVPPTPRDAEGDVDFRHETAVPINWPTAEIREMLLESNEDLSVSPQQYVPPAEGERRTLGAAERPVFRVSSDEPYRWRRGDFQSPALPPERLENLYVANHGANPATFRITLTVAPAFREVKIIPIMAVCVAAFFLVYLAIRAVAPRLSAIALATYKSEIAQPLFTIVLMLGIFALLVFVFLPYNTFGEDIKMLKDSSFSLIMVLCLIQAVWAASVSIAEEVEGRTALTVLSKPIQRPSFVLGKFLGISWTLALTYIVLGLVLLILVAYKPIYDARETAKEEATWDLCHYEMVMTVPGLVLSFMQTLVLAAVSVAISTRLPLLANFVLSFSIFVLGNITPVLVQASQTQWEIVSFFAQLLATVLPNLESFNIQAAIAADVEVPPSYLGFAALYCALYCGVALLLALLLFEDRDLA
ncbi:MAG: transporter [Pirellulaceae bacterium]|nr:MAG: transporter [Pirellulaceae bacterium]